MADVVASLIRSHKFPAGVPRGRITKNTRRKTIISSSITNGGSDMKKSEASGDAVPTMSKNTQLAGPK